MSPTLQTLIDKLTDRTLEETSVIRWGCPVPAFGDLSRSRVATLGLNPSNREFVDNSGKELDGSLRRFHTLNSLGLTCWSHADARHLHLILASCRRYFEGNPYDGWFKALDDLISGTEASYYGSGRGACHLDLIPYATSCKWTELSNKQRSHLLISVGDTLGLLLRDSPVNLLILNGQTVVNNLKTVSDVDFEKEEIPSWTLPRKASEGVRGFAYRGVVREVGGVRLRREILVLGYNHNIQSSFGVTTKVRLAIKHWITRWSQRAM
jgi:hypothetical protein